MNACKSRIIVKLRNGLSITDLEGLRFYEIIKNSNSPFWDNFEYSSFFSENQLLLLEKLESRARSRRANQFGFKSYIAFSYADEDKLKQFFLWLVLASYYDDNIEYVYIEPEHTSPPNNCESFSLPSVEDGSSSLLVDDQTYLTGAPQGIGVSNILGKHKVQDISINHSLVDVEQGWFFRHEDIDENIVVNELNPENGHNRDEHRVHGTRVLGILASKNNDIGCIGVSSGFSFINCSSIWWEEINCCRYNVAYGLLRAIELIVNDNYSGGGVILLEAHRFVRLGSLNEWRHLPVESERIVWGLINLVTSDEIGITIVEAAGNGYYDLDSSDVVIATDVRRSGIHPTWEYDEFISFYEKLRNINNLPELQSIKEDFSLINGEDVFYPDPSFIPVTRGHDSGAILVASAKYENGWKVSDTSCFGERIDSFAQGVDVTTLSTVGVSGSSLYTHCFGQTSAASAIIAGAASLIQGLHKKNRNSYLKPKDLREILKIDATESLPDQRIGVMPNLEALWYKVRPLHWWERFRWFGL